MTIVGITGRKRHGKDTIGDYLVSLGYVKLSFATPLKESCRAIFNFSNEQLYGDEKENIDPRWGVSPRMVLQYVGTDMYRKMMQNIMKDIGEDFWIKCMDVQINDILKNKPNAKIVICDCRFPNEIDYVSKKKGLTIRVTRNFSNKENKEIDVHESEKLIDTLKVDHDVTNNSCLEDLYKKIDALMH